MKKFLLVGLLLALVVVAGCAKDAEARGCGRRSKVSCCYVDEQDNPYGVGFDIKVYDFKKLNEEKQNKLLGFLDAINIENKYDFNNNSYSVFAVLSVDITSLFQKK